MPPLLSFLSSSLPPIRAAVHRTRAEAVRRQLEDCHLVAGIWCHGLAVRQLQGLRAALPATARLVVAKNTLVEKSVEGTPWAALKPCARGMSAWLFVHTDEIRGALKPYRDFQREWRLELNDFTGAVFEGRLYGPDEVEELETMPTRPEIYAYLIGCLQIPALSLMAALQASKADHMPADLQ